MDFWNRVFRKSVKKSNSNPSDEAVNVVQSIANAKILYKSLCVRCHPDKFATDYNKLVIAEDLFKELVDNRYNYSMLLKLEKCIDEKLYST